MGIRVRKPEDRIRELSKRSFRPGDQQPWLFEPSGGPAVVLLSDAQRELREMGAEIDLLARELQEIRREVALAKRVAKPSPTGPRGKKHLFPEDLRQDEIDRILRVCAQYGANYDAVIHAARLYSEQNAVKYASWPAAIEVALANDYQWLRAARQGVSVSSTSARRGRAADVARRVLGDQ